MKPVVNIDNKLQAAFEYFQKGNLEQAELACKDILQLQPDNSDVLHLLGVISYQQGKHDLAVQYINKSIEVDPCNASAYYNLGTVFRENAQLDEAVDSYKKAINIDPANAASYNNLGIALKEKGLIEEAISCYQKALELNPDMIAVYYNMGSISQEKGQFDDALSYYGRAAELDNRNPAVHNSLGLVLKEKGLLDEAVSHYQKAVEYEPDNAAFHNNLGIALKEKGRLDEAVVHLEKSFDIEPNDTALNQIFEISYLILRKGDLQKGWSLYWRFNDSYWQKNIPAKPIWNGSDIQGSTIVIQSDAGFGDVIQYIRYAPLVAERGAKVILNCQKEIVSLLKNVKGLTTVVTDIPLSQFDLFIPIRRLPLVFETKLETIPSEVPYIKANPELVRKWKEKVHSENGKLKVGLVWAAGHGDSNRSCPLSLFAPLTSLQDVTFYSLQVGKDADGALNPPEGMKLIDYTEEIKDFSYTAAIIENLDLTISVDTAVAHVAGAMGKPVWNLLPHIVDSRWLLEREDSPWYPTMKLFRQPSTGDWESVIRRVSESLKALVCL